MIKEITVKSALHYHKTKFASNHDLNIYRGCEHKCEYCFAQYSSTNYLNSDFFDDIYVKMNIAEILDKELSKKTWKKQLINISGICDCYQPLEEKYKLMEGILKILIKHKNPTFILTKSPLILRDYELIRELSEKTIVCIATTITTLNESIRKKIEPNAYPSLDRLNMIEEFAKLEHCQTQVMLMPIIPYLTDTTKNIESIYKICNKININNVIAASLHLRGILKNNFFNFLERNFPDTFKNIQHLYKNSYVAKSYTIKLNKFIYKMKNKYNFHYNYSNTTIDNKTNDDDIQLSLF